jgi:hypothetical protein
LSRKCDTRNKYKQQPGWIAIVGYKREAAMTAHTVTQLNPRKQSNVSDFSIYRWSRRIHARLEVTLYNNSKGAAYDAGLLGTFKTRDLDSRGMFVETGSIKLKPGDVIYINIEITLMGKVNKHWLRGIVVRRNNSGVAIWYSDTQSNAFFRDLAEFQEQ